MRVFLTGATGFIGSAIVPELIQAGHQVLGMTRSDKGAEALKVAGAEPHRGELEDLDSLRSGATQADAVIHCAFDHDFSNFVANCEKDGRAIEALGSALKGSDRPLLITSGVGLGSRGPGQLATEDVTNFDYPHPRKISELTGLRLRDDGVNVSTMRLPQVHNTIKQGLITPFIEISRARGVVAYIGDGGNRFAAAHLLDVARLYVLAIEKADPGAVYNAVAEEGIALREIAQVLATGMKLPLQSMTADEAAAHFGWMAMIATMDLSASGRLTQQRMDWQPTGPGLLEDLRNMQF